MPLPEGISSYLDWMRGVLEGRVESAPVDRHMGFRFTRVEPGRVDMAMDVDERHLNVMGTLHGGIYADLADAALGCAFASTLETGESSALFNLQVSMMRPIVKTTLTASARVVHRGRNLGVVECDVTDSEGRQLARATGTCTVLRGRHAEGRGQAGA